MGIFGKIKKRAKKTTKSVSSGVTTAAKSTAKVSKTAVKATTKVAKKVADVATGAFDDVGDVFIKLNADLKEFLKLFQIFKKLKVIGEIPTTVGGKLKKIGGASADFLEKMLKVLMNLIEDFVVLIFEVIFAIFKIFKKTFIYDAIVIFVLSKITLDLNNWLYTFSLFFNFGPVVFIIANAIGATLFYALYKYLEKKLTPENLKDIIKLGIKEGLKESAKLIEELFQLMLKGVKNIK